MKIAINIFQTPSVQIENYLIYPSNSPKTQRNVVCYHLRRHIKKTPNNHISGINDKSFSNN